MNSTYKIKKQNMEKTQEELSIYQLVNIISSINKKIYDLHKTMEHTKKNELYQKLLLIEEEIIKKREEINNYNEKKNNEEMNKKKLISLNELNNQKIEMDLVDLNENIKDITTDSKNNITELYSISNDEISSILSEKKNCDNLKYLNIDYNFIFNKYQNILNDIDTYKNKTAQLKEKVNMLKEEKSVISTKIMEYISKKESYEELAKIYLFKFFEGIINIDIQKNIKISEENLIIHAYELNGIDIDSLCKEISCQILMSINNENTNYDNINRYKEEQKKPNEEIDNNAFILAIYSKIKKYILEFMNSLDNQYKKDNYNLHIIMNEFFNNISKNIINLLDYYMLISNPISDASSLVIYLKLVFKKYVIENIIKNDSEFLNKGYKKAEESINKDLRICYINLKELEDKEKKYRIKLNSIENKKNDLNKINNRKNILSLKEQKYMNLNEKTNRLIENKNNLNNQFDAKINDYKKENKIINNEILNKIKIIKELITQKKLLEEKIGKRNKIILLEIKKLKKLSSEKFNEIKYLLDIYKKKYGSNIQLYDIFIDKINKSLSSTSKSLMHKYSRRINDKNKTPKNKTYSSIYKNESNNIDLNMKYSALQRRHPSKDYINRNNKCYNFDYY